MSATILGGDITIYYLDENRQKRLKWTGSATGTRTANEVYSACADLFDEVGQMDDGTVMSAETPTEYTIGKIDAGELDPWYISYDCMEHITGGAVRTSGWARTVSSNTGIVVVAVTSNTIVAGDIGFDIVTDIDGDTGTLLDVIESGTTDYLIIRPDSWAAANSFDNDPTAGGGLTCNGNTATQSAAAVTGEQIWANLYSLGTVEADTHIYVYQGTVNNAARARIKSIGDSTQDWWSDGHIDRCFYIRNFKAASAPVIDSGYLTVFARKYATLYDSYEVATSTTSGGRNPIPLATSPDSNNTTGYKSVTTTAVGTDNFTVGNEIAGSTSGARGIITSISGSSPTYTFHYYLIDDPLTDFQTAVETINNNDATGVATKNASAPSNQGPGLTTWYTNDTVPTVSYTAASSDVDDDSANERYGITINCQSNPLTEVYQWMKYTFRRGNTATGNADGIEAEQYIGGEVALSWSGTVTGTIAQGADVTQATSSATGVVISYHNDANGKKLLLRNTRGTFNTTNVVTDNDNSGTVIPNDFATAFSPKKQAPLGTFAGGIFFGARGVLLSNWVTADENAFQLTDIAGNVKARPQAYSITVSNLVGTGETTTTDDRVAVFRLTGAAGAINKTEYSAAGGETIGANTLVVDGAITSNTPGKTTGGTLRIRDASNNNKEYRMRYSSWATSTFTLAEIAAVAGTGTDTDTIKSTNAFANAKRGDLVLNKSRSNAISYITAVTSADVIQISPVIASQVSGDNIELNTCPVAIANTDDVFVPLIDKYAAASTAVVSLITGGDTINYRVVVRNVAATTKIKPFTTDDAITSANRSVATIRTTDTIYT